jgi:hypothetical protein
MAYIGNMTASHIAPGGGVVTFEPQRTFNWILLLSGAGLFSGGDAIDLLRLSVVNVQLPRISTQVLTLRYMNENVKASGSAIVDANSITVRDFVDKNTFAMLNRWMEEVHNPVTGNIGYAANYKKQGSLLLVGPDGEREREIILKGIWPNALQAAELSYESEGTVNIQMSLQVDKYDFTPLMGVNT